MHKTTPEAWMFVFFVVAIIVLPIIIGFMLVKLYRKFKPLEQAKASTNAVAAMHNINHDGFFKILVFGWLICGPIFYLIYTTFLNKP
jgi:hypothetical protein